MRRLFLLVFVFVFLFTSTSYAFDPVAEAEAIINNAVARNAVTAVLVKNGFDAVEAANAILQRAVARQVVEQGLKDVVVNPGFDSATGVFSYVLPAVGAAAIASFLINDIVQKYKEFNTREIFSKPVEEYDGTKPYISFVPQNFSLTNPFITSITYWTWDGEEVTQNDSWDYCNPVVHFLKVDPRSTRSAGDYDIYIDGVLSGTVPNVYEITFQFVKNSDGYVDWLSVDFYYKDESGSFKSACYDPSSRARIDIVPHVTVLPEVIPCPDSDVSISYKVQDDIVVLVDPEPTPEPSPDPSPEPTPEPSPLPVPTLPEVDVSPDLSREVPPDEEVPSDRINFNPLKKAVGLLTYKFPFSLPFDVWRSLKSLQVTPELMSFIVSIPVFGNDYSVIVDFSDYPVLLSFVPFVRIGLLFVFMLSMIYATYELFGGAK